jgi:valyl-tRNA synthetase
LSNEKFVQNAPADVVGQEKQKLTQSQDKIRKLKEQLQGLE